MILTEQLLRRNSKQYWHGSFTKGLRSLVCTNGAVYLTSRADYALDYAVRKDSVNGVQFGSVYTVEPHFSSELNIFNANYTKDCQKMKAQFSQRMLTNMAEKDWFLGMRDAQRSDVCKLLIQAGYEGFFNFETRDRHVPAIGLFNSACTIVKEFPSLQKLGAYDERVSDMIDAYQKESFLIYFKEGFDEMRRATWLFTDEQLDDMADIFDEYDPKDVDEFIKDYEGHIRVRLQRRVNLGL
jgi:hypothetical protein